MWKVFTSVVPELASLLLFGTGLIGVLFTKRSFSRLFGTSLIEKVHK